MAQFHEKFMKNKEANLFLVVAALTGIMMVCINPPILKYDRAVLPGILNLSIFLVMAYVSIKITPVLKNIMAVVALFPMTIYQAATGSPEAILNGASFLFAALCFYYAYGEKEHLGWKETLKLGLVLGILFQFQNVFLWLGLLFFLIPMQKFGAKREYIRQFAVVMAPWIILCGISWINMFLAPSGRLADASAGMTQISYLMEKPDRIIGVVIQTFGYEIDKYFTGFNTLGSSRCSLGPLIWLVPMSAIFTGCLDTYGAYQKIRRKDRLLGLSAFLLICIGIVVNVYTDETINTVGAEFAVGIQGRYFIPVLLAFFLAISQKGIQNKSRYFTEITIGIMGIMLCYAILNLFLCYG